VSDRLPPISVRLRSIAKPSSCILSASTRPVSEPQHRTAPAAADQSATEAVIVDVEATPARTYG
jgi:hypothetical protein